MHFRELSNKAEHLTEFSLTFTFTWVLSHNSSGDAVSWQTDRTKHPLGRNDYWSDMHRTCVPLAKKEKKKTYINVRVRQTCPEVGAGAFVNRAIAWALPATGSVPDALTKRAWRVKRLCQEMPNPKTTIITVFNWIDGTSKRSALGQRLERPTRWRKFS